MPSAYASGALRFDLELPPHAAQEVYLAIPFGNVGHGLRRTGSAGRPVGRGAVQDSR